MVPIGRRTVKGNVAYQALDLCCLLGDNRRMGTGVQPRIHYLEQWRSLREMSREELGDAVGMTRQNIQKIEQFQRPLMQEAIPRFCKALKIDAFQLYLHPDDAAAHDEIPVHKRRKGVDPTLSQGAHFPTGVTKVEQVDIRAGLGGGGEVDSVNHTDGGGYTVSKDAVTATWGVPDSYLGELGVKRNGIFLFRVLGDSMQRPDGSGIHSGDIILADTFDKKPSPPGIFALWDGLGTVVKRIEYIMNSDPARVKIRSDNPNHESYERTLEEVNIIGRCVWYGRRL
jgi:phage repressor protein C with HTH and peptisase S24 domain/DNA-binding Xre family transcriptional regulator